jgi:hypothetical protein
VPRQHRDQRRCHHLRKRPLVRLVPPQAGLIGPLIEAVGARDRRPLHHPVGDPAVCLRDIAPRDGGVRLVPSGWVKDPAVGLEPCGHKRQHAFRETAQPSNNPGCGARIWRTLIATDLHHAAILPAAFWRCISGSSGVWRLCRYSSYQCRRAGARARAQSPRARLRPGWSSSRLTRHRPRAMRMTDPSAASSPSRQ